MAADIKKNGVIDCSIFEKVEYIKLSPSCYINTDVHVGENTDVTVKTVCKWEIGESDRDLMGFSASGGGYWGVNGNTWDSTDRISGQSSNIYEKNEVVFYYKCKDASLPESGVYQIGALRSDYSTRTKYIYSVEIYVDGILKGVFVPVKGGMLNTLTNHLCMTNNDLYSIPSNTELKLYKNTKGVNPNLFLKTNEEVTNNNDYLVKTYEFHGNRKEGLIPGKTYTFSICTTPGSDVTSFNPHISRGWASLFPDPWIIECTGGEKQILTRTFVMPNYDSGHLPSDDPKNSDIYIYRLPRVEEGSDIPNTTIHWIKIEEGDEFTGYAMSENEGTRFICDSNVGKALKYDQKIYTEPDGSNWLHIFHFNKPYYDTFSSSDDFENGCFKKSDQWFNMDVCKYLSSWEFIYKQKKSISISDNEEKYRWVQYINPFNAAYGDVVHNKVTYNTNYPYKSGEYGGICRQGEDSYMCIANSTEGNWYGAIGSMKSLGDGGIPGYPCEYIHPSGYVDVYVRVPDNILSTRMISHNPIECNEIKEI